MQITTAGTTSTRRIPVSLKNGTFAYVRSGEICKQTGKFILLKTTTSKAYAMKVNDWQAECVISAINFTLELGFYQHIQFAG